MNKPLFFVVLFALYNFGCNQKQPLEYDTVDLYLASDKAASLAEKIKRTTSFEVAKGLNLDLWASDSLVTDPIAISVNTNGRIFYTSATRQSNSEFDIRGHSNWITASISFETVEDRRNFLRKTFTKDNDESVQFLKDLNSDGFLDWKDLAVEKEQVWYVEDTDNDGVADHARLYLEDFGQEITDVANGVESLEDEVYVAVGPDLWRTRDTDGNGIADEKQSISHGYAIHIGFSGHGMSGVKKGPDGRIWWGIGDIGANVIDQDGKQWKFPNQGVIARSEPDGSGFEIFCAGIRNTHEFDFDKYGNLISEDNDGDHPGERERLVYLINGSDSGWRTNWQFGKYTDPDNNKYKVWMEEKLHVPRWEGQAAYILPPIQNYVNGPTGLVYNPGTALNEKWYDKFFVAEFRGSAANSPIHAFSLKPDGAGFMLDTTLVVAEGLLPTGLDFGADGALYFGDWIEGWGTKNLGRIWKLDVDEGSESAIRKDTEQWLKAEVQSLDTTSLQSMLYHQDMRVRLKGQWAIANLGKPKAKSLLLKAINQKENQLARVHGLWGLGQLSRDDISMSELLLPYLDDIDDEIATQAAKMLGDVRFDGARPKIIRLLNHTNPRVRMHATEALGRIGGKAAVENIVTMLSVDDGNDNWLRHAGMVALGRLNAGDEMVALKNHPQSSIRIVAVVALRRMGHSGVSKFLEDSDEMVVTEAARAINDDYSIVEALPALAASLNKTSFKGEPYIRRAINANLRVGTNDNIDALLQYASNTMSPSSMRKEALDALATWGKPSEMDRVDGRYRGPVTREIGYAKDAFLKLADQLLNDSNIEIVKSAVQIIGKFGLERFEDPLLAQMQSSSDNGLKISVLKTLAKLKSEQVKRAVTLALESESSELRSVAIDVIPNAGMDTVSAITLLESFIRNGSVKERQSALMAISNYKEKEAEGVLENMFSLMKKDMLNPEIHLDILDAIENQGSEHLISQLKIYNDSKPQNLMEQYKEALFGGDVNRGREIFFEHAGAQCVRCHTIYEWGGDAGPELDGVASRLSREQLLESLIMPSAKYAPGYEVILVQLEDGKSVAGVIKKEENNSLIIDSGGETIVVLKSEITKRETLPSSMIPVDGILSRGEIRDVVAFLAKLENHNS